MYAVKLAIQQQASCETPGEFYYKNRHVMRKDFPRIARKYAQEHEHSDLKLKGKIEISDASTPTRLTGLLHIRHKDTGERYCEPYYLTATAIDIKI